MLVLLKAASNMFSSSSLASFCLFLGASQAHLHITSPAPYNAPENPNAQSKNYDISSPISAAKWPCSGTSGPSVQTLKTGEQASIKFSGGADHNGGSCQVALSFDGQKTFYVLHSFIGGCPVQNSEVSYTVPSDTPLGDATLAWVWHNKVGNREVYANCAGVTVEKGSGGPSPAVAFNNRPDLFVANLGNGCEVPQGTIAIYPNPGPDVTGSTDGTPITGCQPINGIGNTRAGSSGGGSSPPPVSQPSQTASPSTPTTAPSNGPVIGAPPKSPSTTVIDVAPAPAPTGNSPSEKKISTDGTCGANVKCAPGFCCSTSGFW